MFHIILSVLTYKSEKKIHEKAFPLWRKINGVIANKKKFSSPI